MLEAGESVSSAALWVPNLSHRRHGAKTENTAVAKQGDDLETGGGEVRRLKEPMRKLEPQLKQLSLPLPC